MRRSMLIFVSIKANIKSNLANSKFQIIRDAYFKEKTLQNKLNFADIVTETDQRVEKTLTLALKEKYPTHG